MAILNKLTAQKQASKNPFLAALQSGQISREQLEQARAQLEQQQQAQQQSQMQQMVQGVGQGIQDFALARRQDASLGGTKTGGGNTLDDFIQKELVKQQIKQRFAPTSQDVPEGFEITEFRADGTPVIKKKKEPKTPTAAAKRSARRDLAKLEEEGVGVVETEERKHRFGTPGNFTAIDRIKNAFTGDVPVGEYLSGDDAQRILDIAGELGRDPVEMAKEFGVEIPEFASDAEAEAANLPDNAVYSVGGDLRIFEG